MYATHGSFTYSTNALTFDTIEEASAYARDLYSRWTATKRWAILPVSAEPDEGGHWSYDAVSENALNMGPA